MMSEGLSNTVLLLLVFCCGDILAREDNACPDEMTLTGTVCTAIDIDNDGVARHLNFAGGISNCRAIYHPEAHLPHIDSSEENDVFTEIRNAGQNEIEGDNADIWLNLKCNAAEAKWRWQDDGSDVTWSNWGADEGACSSAQSSDYKICAVIKEDGTWGSRKCYTEGLVICQLEPYSHYCSDGCNGGECTELDSGYECVCQENTHGDSCSETCGGTADIGETYDAPSDASCTWEYSSPLDWLLPTVKLSGALEETTDCENESVNIYSGSTSELLHGPLCGDVDGTYKGTKGESMIIAFKRNDALEESVTIDFSVDFFG